MLRNWQNTGGIGNGSTQTSFLAPLGDAGAGVVSLTAQGAGDTTPTFTRNTVAWTKLSTGLWASVGTGVARSSYLGANTEVGAYGGYLAEGVRTNLCLQSRDLSTTWTALNATLLKDQVGIDGVTNSASSMAATLANGSALQTITEAATLSALSMYIKRITGTGTVTIQQGASTLEVSASLNSSTYTRVELDATVLNPAIGIVLGTSGDKIAVDMVQFENGAFASSPIPTTTIAVQRNADVLTYPSAGNFAFPASIYFEHTPQVAPFTSTLIQIDDGSANNRTVQYVLTGTFNSFVANGNITQADVGVGAFAKGVAAKLASVFAANNVNGCKDGTIGTADTTVTIPSGLTIIRISTSTGNDQQAFGTIRNVRIYPSALSAAKLQAMTS